MIILKIIKNKALHSLQTVYFLHTHILRVNTVRMFFNEISILDFAELAIFHSI